MILSAREAFFSTLKKEPTLAEALRLSPSDCRLFEVKCLRHSLKQARSHGSLQAALNRAIHLSALASESDALGSHFGDVVAQDFAGVLWDHGNMTTSIQMLKQLNESKHGKQSIPLSRPALLAEMVRQHTRTMIHILTYCRVLGLQKPGWRGLMRSSTTTSCPR